MSLMDKQKSFRKMVAANSKKRQVLESGSKGRGGHVRTPYTEVARGLLIPTHPQATPHSKGHPPGSTWPPPGQDHRRPPVLGYTGPQSIVPGQSESPHAGQDSSVQEDLKADPAPAPMLSPSHTQPGREAKSKRRPSLISPTGQLCLGLISRPSWVPTE